MDYSQFVMSRIKNPMLIMQEITPEKANLIHMTMGLSGETGELLDAIKKHVIYGKELDMENIVEELGDIEFFLEGLRQQLGINRQDVLALNINKLSIRYKEGYSDEEAQARADKAESEATE